MLGIRLVTSTLKGTGATLYNLRKSPTARFIGISDLHAARLGARFLELLRT